jgi:hypothetical protein
MSTVSLVATKVFLFFGILPRFLPDEWSTRLKGQSAAKAVAATGRGKPLRVSTPWTDSA